MNVTFGNARIWNRLNILRFCLRILLFLYIPFHISSCYHPPQNLGFLDFFSFKSDLDALSTPVPVYVQVSGLSGGTLTVANGSGESLVFTSNTSQQFPTLVKYRTHYSVSITSLSGAPSGLTCNVNNPNGPILLPSATIFVSCGVTFSDLIVRVVGLDTSLSSSLVITNAGDTLFYSSDSTQTFAHRVGDSATYTVGFISVPAGHTCNFVPAGSETGTMSSGPLTLTLNCYSLLKITPQAETIDMRAQISIQITGGGLDIGSCSFDPIVIGGATNGGTFGTTPPTISYPGTVKDTILLTPNTPDFWPSGITFFQLIGCTAHGFQINNGLPIFYSFNVPGEFRFVDVALGNDAVGCGTGFGPNRFCRSIEQGVTECDNTTVQCTVYVAEGIYDQSAQIVLSGVTSILGGYPSGFPNMNASPVAHPTLIRDLSPTGFCNLTPSFGNICSNIVISTSSVNPSSAILTVSGFQVQANLNPLSSTSILVLGSISNTGKIIISQNQLFGKLTPANDGFFLRIGLAVDTSDNILIKNNSIIGGTGTDFSAGLFLANSGSGSPILVFGNTIDSLGTIPGGLSQGLNIFSTISVIGYNKINAIQFQDSTQTSLNSAGILLNGESFLINNDIYMGNGTNSVGINSGVFTAYILNNQIFAKAGSFTGSTGIYYSDIDTMDPLSIVRGNNFFVDIPVHSGASGADYRVCGTTLASISCIAGVPVGDINLAGVGDYSNNYGVDPKFITSGPPPISQSWNFNIPSGSTLPSSANTPCSSIYGGINPLILPLPVAAFPFLFIDFYGNPVSLTPTILTPTGGDSISVGASEVDANCL